MSRGVSETRPTQLPARYRRLYAWDLDRRSKAVREISADLGDLWQDLGGVENLSAQKRWLVERTVFLRQRMLGYETAILAGTETPMTDGEYSNFANVLLGHLKALGLERKARAADSFAAYLAKDDAA